MVTISKCLIFEALSDGKPLELSRLWPICAEEALAKPPLAALYVLAALAILLLSVCLSAMRYSGELKVQLTDPVHLSTVLLFNSKWFSGLLQKKATLSFRCSFQGQPVTCGPNGCGYEVPFSDPSVDILRQFTSTVGIFIILSACLVNADVNSLIIVFFTILLTILLLAIRFAVGKIDSSGNSLVQAFRRVQTNGNEDNLRFLYEEIFIFLRKVDPDLKHVGLSMQVSVKGERVWVRNDKTVIAIFNDQ